MNKDFYLHFTTENFLEDEFFRKWACTPDSETNHFWQTFIHENPDKATAIQEAKNMLQSLHGHFETEVKKVPTSKAQASFNKIAPLLTISKKKRTISKRRWIVWTMAVAASVLLILSIGSFLFFPKENFDITYATGNGQRLPLELPDGSTVQLNANSTLFYNSKDWWDKEKRQVWLEGEAYFKVEKKALGTKFIVHARDMKVAVLGTQFNVRSRGEDAEVVLAEGKVELDIADQHISMKPGDMVAYSKEKSKVEAKKVKPADYSAWKDGITVFNDNLSEVVKELEILYGVPFLFKNEALKNRKIQLSVPADNLEQVLETLELLYPGEISIEKEDDKVIIF